MADTKDLLDNYTFPPLVISGNTKRIDDNEYAFKQCCEIIIEEGVEEIGGWAFVGTGADKAIIPSTVTKIGENPFPHTNIYNVVCKSPNYTVKDDILIENATMRLVSFVGKDRYSGKKYSELKAADNDTSQKFEYTIPQYIKILGEGSFRGRRLDKIIIPDTIEKILQNPFVECSAEIINHSPNYKLDNGLLIELETNTLISYVGKEKDIIVPEGVDIIEGSTFELLEYGVDSISLPGTIREIRDNFGEHCNLKHIFVPKGKEDFFKSLLPKYEKIIRVAGTDPNAPSDEEIKNIEEKREEERAWKEREAEVLKEEKEKYKPEYPMYIFVFVFCFVIGSLISYLVGCLCSWSFSIFEWNILSFIIAGIIELLTIALAIYMPIHGYKDEMKDIEWRVSRKVSSERSKKSLINKVNELGGIAHLLKYIIDALGYPIIEECDNWISLKISEDSSIKIEQTDWYHQCVTYNINENGKHIEQSQSFKTMGYMPMVTSSDEIIQTIKEKIWSFGLLDKPISNVPSKNKYNIKTCLIRDLYIIAYRNEGKITKKADGVIQSFARNKSLNDEIVNNIKFGVSMNNGSSPANILDCYPELEDAKNDYLKELISIHKYTSKKSLSEGYNYLCEVAEKLGKTEDDIKELV